MKKLQLILLDSDSLYLKSFGEYILSSNLNAKFDVKLFSNTLSFKQHLSSGQTYDVLLIQPSLYDSGIIGNEKGLVVLLKEEEAAEEGPLFSVFKYQPLNQLISSILSVYYENHSSLSGYSRNGGKTKVISIYSPSGGSGKSTISANMSRQLALRGDKVFYLNLELMNTTSLYFRSQQDQPSLQILYYLKARPNQLLAKVEALKKYDPESKVDYFDLPPCPDEMMAITKEETKRLIYALIETQSYDYIIIDLDSAIHDRIAAAFEESSLIIWLLNNDLQSFHKTSAYIERMNEIIGTDHDIEGKLAFIMNRFNGQFPEAYMKYNLPIQGYLSNIQEWALGTEPQQQYYHPLFTQELLSIVEDIVVRNQVGVTID